jgi:hypothetical protein
MVKIIAGSQGKQIAHLNEIDDTANAKIEPMIELTFCQGNVNIMV